MEKHNADAQVRGVSTGVSEWSPVPRGWFTVGWRMSGGSEGVVNPPTSRLTAGRGALTRSTVSAWKRFMFTFWCHLKPAFTV